jgi:trimeric autotransporter adhesin
VVMTTTRLVQLASLIVAFGFFWNRGNTAPGDERWDFRFGRVGIDATVLALTWHEGQLHAAGWFKTAGHTIANSITRWDGTNFWPLGEGLEASNGVPVFAAASFRGRLYAGGEFNRSGTNELNGLVAWNGTNWFNAGLTGRVYSLTVVDDALYIGGALSFPTDTNTYGVIRWDGTAWNTFDSRVGSCPLCGDAYVSGITARGNEIFVTGQFDSMGDTQQAFNRARWNGTNWEQFVISFAGSIYQMQTYRSDLIAAGTFTEIEGTTATNIARWDGTNWHALGAGLGDNVDRLYVDQTTLYAVGSFTNSGDLRLDKVARWNGSQWNALGTTNFRGSEQPYAIVSTPQGRLDLAGYFASTSGKPAGGLATWSGTEWQPITPRSARGVSGSIALVYTLASSPEALYVGGIFEAVGTVPASKIARMTESTISPLGSGATNFNARVRAIAVQGSNAFAGGIFTNIGGNSVRFVARWDGNEWTSIGTGANSNVFAIIATPTNVIVGGQFTEAGGVSANRVAAWNGSTWAPLGSGMDQTVLSFTWQNNLLYAGGTFTNAGGIRVNRVAVWNGVQWSPLGNGLDDLNARVDVVTASGSNIYVGGRFTSASGVVATNVAVWNGAQWNSLGTGAENGVGGEVTAIAVLNGNVFVGGRFTNAGTKAVTSLARWDGTNWSPLGSGLDFPQLLSTEPGVRVLALLPHRGDLYVAGLFTVAGGYPAYSLARWVETPKLQLDSVNSANNPVRLHFRGLAGLRYRLEATETFSSWTPVHSGRGVDETEEVSDAAAAFRFYRALLTE